MNCEKVYDIPREDMKTNESGISLTTWDTYNGVAKENPDVCQTIQTRPQVPNHGERIVIGTNDGESHEVKVDLLGGIGEKTSNKGTQWYEQNRIYDSSGLCTAIPAEQSFHPYYGRRKSEMKRLRIRKLTEGECMRLMGFEEADTQAMRDAGLSKSTIYHSAGDSIVTAVLVGLFGSLLGDDYGKKIDDYSDKLRKETL